MNAKKRLVPVPHVFLCRVSCAACHPALVTICMRHLLLAFATLYFYIVSISAHIVILYRIYIYVNAKKPLAPVSHLVLWRVSCAACHVAVKLAGGDRLVVGNRFKHCRRHGGESEHINAGCQHIDAVCLCKGSWSHMRISCTEFQCSSCPPLRSWSGCRC